MQVFTEKKKIRQLTMLLTLVYMISYITRINYGAVIAEIVRAEGYSKAAASLALTGSAITYGLGQLISGYLGDRIQPKRLILWGLITTMITNFSIPLCHAPYQMTVLWCINGMAQAFMWPPIVRLISLLLPREAYSDSCFFISCGSHVGTILVYLISPLCIMLSGWKAVFFTGGLCVIPMILLWIKLCPTLSEAPVSSPQGNTESSRRRIPWSVLFVFIMLAIVLQGALRDGVSTWLPSLVIDSFHLAAETSILTGVLLPIFSILVSRLTAYLYQKRIRNELHLAGLLFGIGFIAALLLALTKQSNLFMAILCTAILSACMHGVNFALICIVPPYFSMHGCVSQVSGILNSCTYVGSALSTYGIAVFADCFGWNSTVYLWSAIALCGAVICFLFQQKWDRDYKHHDI